MKKARVHLIIRGDVTGVGYRSWTKRIATKMGLSGYVRNVASGQVEAVIEGEEEKVNAMIESCKAGPEVSRVEKVEASWEKMKGEFANFEIRL